MRKVTSRLCLKSTRLSVESCLLKGMHHLNRQQSVGYGYGVYVALLTIIFAVYQFAGPESRMDRGAGMLHPIHSICAVRYRPDSDTYISITRAINEASTLYGVSAELISAVISAESGCRTSVRSKKGAIGLMQLMPATAKHLGIADPYSVRENIFGGTKYLAQLLKSWDGDKELALASYNAGPSKVRKYKEIPPYKETQHYVKKVLHLYRSLGSNGYSRT